MIPQELLERTCEDRLALAGLWRELTEEYLLGFPGLQADWSERNR
jgi:hypothetical protein